MKIKILYNLNQVKKELLFIEKNVAYFKKNNMFFYFPFESIKETSTNKISEQIHKDEKIYKPEKVLNSIEKKWEKTEGSVFNCLLEYNKKVKIFEFKKEYKCHLSFYGCYGYYDYPDKIFANIFAKPEFIIETIIHELIHLLIYKKTIKKTYSDVERLVDRIFIDSGISKIFPKYKEQQTN
jgi:phosphoenolpyruvate synthase/pyruvate phosphate dikinase